MLNPVSMPKLIHFRDTCIGCNGCVEAAPQYWEMNDADGKADMQLSKKKGNVHQREIMDIEIDCNRCAALACPMNIIKIYGDNGKDITND